MVTESQFVELIKQAKENGKERKFKQSLEMIMVFKDVDVKKDLLLMRQFNYLKKWVMQHRFV